MTSLWPWLAIAGLGALHGLNPAGWMLPAACGVHARDRGRALRALLPMVLGHAASMALVAAAVAFGLSLDRAALQATAAVLLAVLLLLGQARCIGRPARALAGDAGLALWAFLLSGAHGAGLLLVPALIPLCADGVLPHAGAAAGPWTLALAAVGVHTAAMLAVTGAVALAACRGAEAVAGLRGRRDARPADTSRCPDPASREAGAALPCGHGFSAPPSRP